MRKIKVLYLYKEYRGNRSLRNDMILGLDSNCFHAKACYLSGKPDGKNILDQYGRSVYLDIRNPKKHMIRTLRTLRSLLTNERPDILHCHQHGATVLGTLARLMHEVKIISHVHGLRRTRSLNRRLTNWILLRYVDKIITVSDGVKHDVIETNYNLDASKVVTVRNGINLHLIDNVKASRIDARVKLGVSNDEIVLGTVGRLAKTKGHSYLIESFSKVKKQIPNSKLIIIGDGPLSNELKKKAENLAVSSDVLFTGYRKDVLELLRGLDVFIFPSLAEGLPLALLEAMASRLPVIASNVGGIPEVFGISNCGILVPSMDSNTLAKAMLEIGLLNEEKRKVIGDAARKRVEDAFTAEIMCKNLGEVYESVIST